MPRLNRTDVKLVVCQDTEHTIIQKEIPKERSNELYMGILPQKVNQGATKEKFKVINAMAIAQVNVLKYLAGQKLSYNELRTRLSFTISQNPYSFSMI